MRIRVLAAAVSAIALALSGAAFAQSGTLNGVWISAGMRAAPAAGDTQGSGARSAQASGANEPPLKPEYLTEWRARAKLAQEKEARGEAPFEDWVACLPTGVPSMMNGIFPIEVLETPGQVTIVAELFNQTRRVYLDRAQTPPDDTEPSYFGRSVGKWEGDTLVVDTVAVKENARYRDVPHSPERRISERIKRVGDILEDQVTIVDPMYLTGPWTFTIRNRKYPDYEMREYVCENNRVYVDSATGQQKLRVEGK